MSETNDQTATQTEQRPAARRHGRGQGPRPAEKAINFGPSLRRLLGYLKPDLGKLITAIAMLCLVVAANVFNPKVMGWATDVIFRGVVGKALANRVPAGTPIDAVIEQLRANGDNDFADMLQTLQPVVGEGIDFTHLGHIVLLGVGLAVFAFALSSTEHLIVNRVVANLVYRLREQVNHKLDRLPLSYFDKQSRGELMSRVSNDIDNVSQTLTQALNQVLNAVLTLIGVTIMMFTISPLLAVVTLLLVPVSGFLAAMIGKRSQRLFADTWKTTGELNSQAEEGYTGHSLVKVFGRQKEVQAEFDKTNEELFRASFGAQFISGIIMPTMFFVGNINYVVVAVLGGIRVASGHMGLGGVQAFIQYSRMFTQPITQVASMANLLQSGVASAERVFEVFDADEMSPETTGELPDQVQGRVEFHDVDFSYRADKPLIEGLNLVAEPGQTVAIVGPTGAGKTTLVNLLMRFYEVQGGSITIDGVDITSVPRSELRQAMGMVLQDTWLFSGSIKDNIGYGRPGASDDEIIAAAKAAFVDRFVHALPDGYDTVIDEEGSNVSAGEKQLITIARAFLADPNILILDEATSSVDTRTELLVQDAMAGLRSGRTSFVIAHRLSTIRDADLILVMMAGSIVEQGTHDELLAKGGHYAELYQAQFDAASDPDEE